MLWLIWVALMIAVPMVAGVGIWYEMQRERSETAPMVVLPTEQARAE